MICATCGESLRVGGPAFRVERGVARCEPYGKRLAAVRSVAQAAIAAVRQPAAMRPTRATGSPRSPLWHPTARGER